jgi:hypothetical protein
MKIKTSDLKDLALDWAVATALGRGPKYNMESHGRTWRGWWLVGPGFEYEPMPSYSTEWAQGGPIIEREGIAIDFDMPAWCASDNANPIACYGPTPLIAAMRCYVTSKLGEFVEIPDELKG